MVSVTDVPLAAPVRPSGRAELPPGVVPLIHRESDGVVGRSGRRGRLRAAATWSTVSTSTSPWSGTGCGRHGARHGHLRRPLDLPPRPGGSANSCWCAMPSAGPTRSWPTPPSPPDRIRSLLRAATPRWSLWPRARAMVPAGRGGGARGTGAVPRCPDRFVLHVGNIEPRKDIPTLAEACRSVRSPAGPHRSQPVGPPTAGRRPSRSGMCRLDDLPGLYGAATVVGYASRYEGFGLPPHRGHGLWGRRGDDAGARGDRAGRRRGRGVRARGRGRSGRHPPAADRRPRPNGTELAGPRDPAWSSA